MADTSCFYPNGMVEINELGISSSNLKIYPNPTATKIVTVEFNALIKVGKLELYNTFGEKVLEKNLFHESKKEINLQKVSQGVYFVKVFDGEKSYCKKLIVE